MSEKSNSDGCARRRTVEQFASYCSRRGCLSMPSATHGVCLRINHWHCFDTTINPTVEQCCYSCFHKNFWPRLVSRFTVRVSGSNPLPPAKTPLAGVVTAACSQDLLYAEDPGSRCDWLPLSGASDHSSAELTSAMTDSALSPTSALSMDLRHPPP